MDNNLPNDERMRVLRMVEEGKLSAAEAVSLLDAMSRKPARPEPPAAPRPAAVPLEPRQPRPGTNGGPRWFKVRVTDLATGRAKTTVNIPLALMDWGIRIGAHFAPEVSQYDMQELVRIMREEGVDGKVIDVTDEEDGEHVEIFVE
jgi:hypothetical protein